MENQKKGVVVLFLIILIGGYFFLMPKAPSPISATPTPEAKCLDPIQTIYGKDVVETELNTLDVSGDEFNALGKYGFPNRVFAKLPEYPLDLDGKLNDFKSLRITLENITANYYKQPEFYSNFKTAGVPLMENYPTNQHAAFGYGTYPAEYIVTTGANAEFNVYFLVRTDWGVVNYQGIRLFPYVPKEITSLRNSFSDGSRKVVQDPAYVNCQMQILEVTPFEILLEPAYPAFSPGWAKKVKLSIRTGNIKPGKYAVGLDIGGPSDAFNDKMYEKFAGRYVTGGGFGTDSPWLMLYIEVK